MDANVQALVTNLTNGEADVAEMPRLYDDVIMRLAGLPVFVRLSTSVAPVAGKVSLSHGDIQLLLAFHNNIQLGELSIREADWLLPNWRGATGTPYNFVRESMGSQQIQLVPAPTANNSATLTSYNPETLPVWMQLPVALLIIADEYQRESPHQKLMLANAARSLGNFLIACITTRLSSVLQQRSQ